MEAVKANGFR